MKQICVCLLLAGCAATPSAQVTSALDGNSAPQPATACVPATQTNPGTYKQVQAILQENPNVQQNCINCHAPGQSAPDLSTYDAITLPGVGAQILLAINMVGVTIIPAGSWQPMPPETAALTTAQIATITSWVNACQPND